MVEQADKQLKQYHMLINLSQELTSKLDIKTVLSIITQYAAELLNVHSAVLLLRDELNQETTYVSVYNVTEELLQKKLTSSESLGNQIIDNGISIVLNDYASYKRRVALLEQYNIKAVLGVPIIWQGKPIGALNVHATNPEQCFTEYEKNLLFGFANYAAIAIMNAKLYEKMVKELKYNNIVVEISRKSSSCSNVQEFIDVVVLEIKSLYPKNNFVMMVYNSIFSTINYAATCELTLEEIERLKKIVEDRLLNKQQNTQNKAAINLIYGLSNAMAMPLICKQTVKGYLFLLESDLNQETIITIQNIAIHTSVVLEGILLHLETRSDFRRTVNEISTLHYAIHKITELSLKEDLEKQILNLMMGLANSDKGGFFSYQEQNSSFKPYTAVGIKEEDKNRLAEIMSDGYGKFSMTQITPAEEIKVGDFKQILKSSSMNNTYLLPLIFQKHYLGVIILDLKPHNNSDIILLMLRIFGDISSIIIRNAQLYQNERKTVLELKDSNTLLKKVFDTNNQLLMQALNNMKITDIAKIIQENTGCLLLIEDRAGNALAKCPEDMNYLTIWDMKKFPEFRESFLILNERKEPVLHRETEGILRYVVPLSTGDRVLGYLSLITHDFQWGMFQKHISEASALTLSLILVNINCALKVEHEVRGEVLEALIDEKYWQKKEDILYRAKHVGLSEDSSYRLMVIKYAEGEPGSKVMAKKSIIGSLLVATNKMPVKIFYTSTPNWIIIACPVEDSSRKQIEMLLNIIKEDLKHERKAFHIGVSSVLPDLLDFHKGFLEARQGIIAGKVCKIEDVPIYFDDMGFLGFLIHEENKPLIINYINNYIGPLIRNDKIHDLQLLDTLEAYIDNNCNMGNTAQVLFIHVNTLKYRLKKIKELIFIDFNKIEYRTNLFIVCKMYRITSFNEKLEL